MFIFLCENIVAKEIVFNKKEFVITLPELWKEIPTDVIAEYQSNLVARMPNVKHPEIDYGFQQVISLNWFDTPNILISVSEKGRLSKRNLFKIPLVFDKIFKDQIKQRKLTGKNISSNYVFYDEKSNIIYTKLSTYNLPAGNIENLTAMIPTEKGMINVTCTSTKKDFKKYEPVFKSVISSLKLKKDYVYKKRWTDRLPTFVYKVDWIDILGNVIDIAILAFVIFILYRRANKNKSQSAKKFL